MRYLGILCVQNKNISYKFVGQLERALKQICPHVIQVSYEDDILIKVGNILKNTDFSVYSGIVILKDELFGAFYSLDVLFRKMREKYDVWGLGYDVFLSERIQMPVLYDALIVIEEKVSKSLVFREKIELGIWKDYLLYDKRIVRGCIAVEDTDEKENPIDICSYMPYETVVRRRVPFLPIKSFSVDKMLRYSLQHELRRTIEYLEQSCIPTDMVWEYIIAEMDIGDLKKVLHLEYLISADSCETDGTFRKKVAVFAHIYYEDLYDRCLSYFVNLPSEIDLYLSTKRAGLDILKEKLKTARVSVKKLFAAGERGRDAGALLLCFAPYIQEYDYICFIHDKKSSGGISPLSEGMSFMDLVWDNLIPNSKYIQQIVNLFETHKYLGVIAPPVPIMGIYLSGLLGNEWTICFEETQKLAEKLSVNIKIAEDKLPFVLSTCFWCRPEALESLFAYPWKIEEFPEEPLKLDGTINHAIERIIPYLAQNRGYYTALAYQIEYASLYISNLTYIADELFRELRKGELVTKEFPISLQAELDFMRRLLLFTETHEEIYVYGAGAQGKTIKRKLDMLKVKPVAFLVSGWNGNDTEFEGCKVQLFLDAREKMSIHTGIVVALSNKYADEVIPNLGNIDYFRIDVE